MKVHEIMTAHPQTVAPHTTLVEAAGLMRQLDVGALPVFDGDDLAGIVTDRDMVVRGVADGNDPNTSTVSDVMSGGIEFVFADQEVEEAVKVMEQRQIRRLPVLDGAKKLVGMLSLGDVAMSSNPAFGGMALREVSEPHEPSARQRRLAMQSEPIRMPMTNDEDGEDGGSQPRAPRRTTTAARRARGTTRKAAVRSPRKAGRTSSRTRRTSGRTAKSRKSAARKSPARSRR